MPGAFGKRLAAAGVPPAPPKAQPKPATEEEKQEEAYPQDARAGDEIIKEEATVPVAGKAGAAPQGPVCWTVVYEPYVPVRETPAVSAKMVYYKSKGERVWSTGEPDPTGWIELVGGTPGALQASQRGGWMLVRRPGIGALLERCEGDLRPPLPEAQRPEARCETEGDMGESPLALAVREGELRQVLLLLEQRADPDAADLLGETPLFEAVAGAHLDVAAALLLRRADPTRQSPTGSSAFEQAEEGLMQTLLSVFQGDDVEDMAGNALYEALSPQIQRGMMNHLREKQAMREMAAMRALSAAREHGAITEE